MKIIYTAIFGSYEELKDPMVITPGWKYVCFTDQKITSLIWEIRPTILPLNDIIAARMVKILCHQFLDRDTDVSIWVDGSFTINCNLDKWMSEHFKGEMTCIKHPIRDCIYEEGEVCIRQGKDSENIPYQLESYEHLVPKRNGLIQSGILMRVHTGKVKQLCEEWFWEINNHSTRDQISFGKVSLRKKFINYTKWDYRTGKEFIFKTHFKNRKQ